MAMLRYAAGLVLRRSAPPPDAAVSRFFGSAGCINHASGLALLRRPAPPPAAVAAAAPSRFFSNDSPSGSSNTKSSRTKGEGIRFYSTERVPWYILEKSRALRVNTVLQHACPGSPFMSPDRLLDLHVDKTPSHAHKALREKNGAASHKALHKKNDAASHKALRKKNDAAWPCSPARPFKF